MTLKKIHDPDLGDIDIIDEMEDDGLVEEPVEQ